MNHIRKAWEELCHENNQDPDSKHPVIAASRDSFYLGAVQLIKIFIYQLPDMTHEQAKQTVDEMMNELEEFVRLNDFS